jgi:hypothetical protein
MRPFNHPCPIAYHSVNQSFLAALTDLHESYLGISKPFPDYAEFAETIDSFRSVQGISLVFSLLECIEARESLS